jgi:hypothetical protein
MATYKGNDIAPPDRLDEDLKLVGRRLNGLENVEEELNLPPSTEPDAMRRPGQKGYMENQQMAGQPSGKAPGKTPYAPGGAEVWSDSDRDYFTDPRFHRDTSIDQSHQQSKDVERLDKLKSAAPSFNQGGMVKHGSSTRVTCSKKG